MTKKTFLATDETLIKHGVWHSRAKKAVCIPCLFRVSSVAKAAILCAVLFSACAARAAGDIAPGGAGYARITPKTDAQVPLDLSFRDEAGQPVTLGDYFRPNRPVVLMMVYFRCKAICGPALEELTRALKEVDLQPGQQFEIVTVSFNPDEGPEMAAQRKEGYIKLLGKSDAAADWHFLTSSDAAAGKTLGDAIGFGYRKNPNTGDYQHEAGIFVCTPEGRVSRVQLGVKYDPAELHDSLINASQGKISSRLFGVALSCGLLDFDAATGRYVLAAVAIMRITGITTVLLLASGIGWMVYRENRKKNLEQNLEIST